MGDNIGLMMPIKATPYEHQKRAFAFALQVFGILQRGGDAYDSIDKRGKGCALLMEM